MAAASEFVSNAAGRQVSAVMRSSWGVIKIIHCWGFDPGETTGWCHLSVHDGETGVFNCGEGDLDQIGNLLFDNQTLQSATNRRELEVIFVVEKFVINSKITPSPWSLETTGLIRYFANHSHIPLHIQTPSQAKTLITNEVIKRAGLYVPGKPHAMDAVRHVLFYLTTKKRVLQECLLKS